MSEMTQAEDVHSQIAQAQQPRSVAVYLAQLQPEIARALPKGMDADRITRLALTVVRQSEMAKRKGQATTSLADCSFESVAGALMTAAALGLEVGVGGEAYLVPYGKEATFIPGYQGIAKLFFQHPLARHLDAQAVHEHDDFDYELGLRPFLRHKPARGARGAITHYYAVASLSTGAQRFEVMTTAEVAAVRAASRRRSSDIRDPQHWMERKVVLKQLLKLMPKSTRLQYAIEADEQSGTELTAQQVPARIGRSEIEPGPASQDAGGPVYETPEPVPDDVDPLTGEILEPDQPAENIPADIPETSPAPTTAGEAGPAGSNHPSMGNPPTAGRPPGNRATAAQRAQLVGQFQRLQILDGEEQLFWACRFAELEDGSLTAIKDLRRPEADQVIDALAKFPDRDRLDATLQHHNDDDDERSSV